MFQTVQTFTFTKLTSIFVTCRHIKKKASESVWRIKETDLIAKKRSNFSMSRVTMKYLITMCYASILSFHLVLENTATLKAVFIYTGVIDFFYD